MLKSGLSFLLLVGEKRQQKIEQQIFKMWKIECKIKI
jgi:hypothetical protein